MINKISAYYSALKGTRLTTEISNSLKNSYAGVKNIFGEMFPKFDADYDKFVLGKKQKVKASKSRFDWDSIGKMLTFKI